MKRRQAARKFPKADSKQILSVALATVNTVNTLTPLALPIVAAARDLPQTRYTETAAADGRTLLIGGAEVLDRIIFRVAEAGGTITGNVTVTVDTDHDTINSGGTQTVINGGTASVTTISSGGTQNILTSGHATFTTVENSGTQNISAAGMAVNGTITFGGTQNVLTDGQAILTTVQSGGTQSVSTGGMTTGTEVISGGILAISAGGTAVSAALRDGYVLRADTSATLASFETGNVFSIVNGTASSITVNSGGYLNVLSGHQASNTTVNSGGVENILSGGTAIGTVIGNLGTQTVSAGGTAISTTINNGGTQSLKGTDNSAGLAVASNTIVSNGGVQNLYSYASATSTTVTTGGVQNLSGSGGMGGAVQAGHTLLDGGTQNILHSGWVNNTTVTGGGVLNISAGNTARYTTVTNGTVNVAGIAESTTISAGGTQTVSSGGHSTATQIDGGVENILNGGIASGAVITNDGTQNVSAGGTAISTTIHACIQNVSGIASGTIVSAGGTQNVLNGGLASGTIIYDGGLETVYNGGTTSDTTVAGGTLSLKTGAAVNGTTTLSAGEIALGDALGSYHITGLVVSGGSVRLAYGTTTGRTLNIASLTGSTNFIINTDLATGSADRLNITSVTGTSANTVQVYYDPIYLTGRSLSGSAAFATIAPGVSNISFTGRSSEYGAYSYTPTLTSGIDGSGNTTWSVTALTIGGESETVRTANDIAATALLAWRSENNNLIKRMGELRDSRGEAGFWLRSYAGEQTLSNAGRSSREQYSAIQGGYDKRIERKDGVWILGGMVGYRENRNNYERGNGTSNNFSFGAYASWLGKRGHFLDLIAKAGVQHNHLTSYLKDGANTAVDGQYDTWGQSLSVEYGYRKPLRHGWYIEPQAELTFSRMNAAGYTASDGTQVDITAGNSLMGRIGLAVGRKTGGSHFYGRVSAVREFSATSAVSAFNGGLASTLLEQDLRETWLEFALGVTTVLNGKTNAYLELTQTTGAKIRTPWQLNVGARWQF